MALAALLAVPTVPWLWRTATGAIDGGSAGGPQWPRLSGATGVAGRSEDAPAAAPGATGRPAAPATSTAGSAAARATSADDPEPARDSGSTGDSGSAGSPASGGGTAWALWTAASDTMIGSDNRDSWTNSTESMVKPWIVADFLRRLGTREPTSGQRTDAIRAIVHSDDQATQRLYRAGGADAVVNRMIRTCGLVHTSIRISGRWSYTYVSAADAVRLGRCVADGRAAGSRWTPWVLKQMRQVEGAVTNERDGGRWGIIDGLPARSRAGVAIKNGWTSIKADQMWHLNCLAVTETWVLSVLTRYPAERGKAHGAEICRDRTRDLVRGGALPAR